MDEATSWAIKQFAAIPAVPVPLLLGICIIALWVYPTIRRALKADVRPDNAPTESQPVVQMQAGGIYTILTNIEIAIGDVRGEVAELRAGVEIIDRMLRRRGKRSPKSVTSPRR